MLDKAIRHLVQRKPDILETDFLADDIERCGRETVVHRAHHAGQYGAVANAGVEHALRAGAGEYWPVQVPPAMQFFSEQVFTNSRYFCRLSKKRKLRCGSSLAAPDATGGTAAGLTTGRTPGEFGRTADASRRRAVQIARHE